MDGFEAQSSPTDPPPPKAWVNRSRFQAQPGTPSGDHGTVVPPVPIPNTEVKHCCADDSWAIGPAKVGRCQSITPPIPHGVGGVFFSGRKVEYRQSKRVTSPTHRTLRQSRANGDPQSAGSFGKAERTGSQYSPHRTIPAYDHQPRHSCDPPQEKEPSQHPVGWVWRSPPDPCDTGSPSIHPQSPSAASFGKAERTLTPPNPSGLRSPELVGGLFGPEGWAHSKRPVGGSNRPHLGACVHPPAGSFGVAARTG